MGASLFYCNLISLKVYLSDSSLGCNVLYKAPSCFLSVQGKVLDGSCNTDLVHALKLCCCALSCKEWIL